MPICTRLVAGAFLMLVAWNHGVVCIRSSRSVSWVSTWRSKWMMPMLPSMYGASPRMVGKPMEWSPPSTIGMTPFCATCAMAWLIWSNDFSRLPGMVNTSPMSTMLSCSRRSTPDS